MKLREILVRALRRLFKKRKKWYEINMMQYVAECWATTKDDASRWRKEKEWEEFQEYLKQEAQG